MKSEVFESAIFSRQTGEIHRRAGNHSSRMADDAEYRGTRRQVVHPRATG
jgi:hypothetical protein